MKGTIEIKKAIFRNQEKGKFTDQKTGNEVQYHNIELDDRSGGEKNIIKFSLPYEMEKLNIEDYTPVTGTIDFDMIGRGKFGFKITATKLNLKPIGG